jgi:hypothetical protein
MQSCLLLFECTRQEISWPHLATDLCLGGEEYTLLPTFTKFLLNTLHSFLTNNCTEPAVNSINFTSYLEHILIFFFLWRNSKDENMFSKFFFSCCDVNCYCSSCWACFKTGRIFER